MTHKGQYSYVASRVVGNVSTISQRKSGRDEARRISCNIRKHVTEVERGLINHIHRYNRIYLAWTLDLSRTYVHARVYIENSKLQTHIYNVELRRARMIEFSFARALIWNVALSARRTARYFQLDIRQANSPPKQRSFYLRRYFVRPRYDIQILQLLKFPLHLQALEFSDYGFSLREFAVQNTSLFLPLGFSRVLRILIICNF